MIGLIMAAALWRCRCQATRQKLDKQIKAAE